MDNTHSSPLAEQTLERLRSSIRVNGPLPGLASAVRLIEIAEKTDSRNDDDIVKAVLGDPSLLQKVLRLANSAMYAAFGGYVDTVSRALAILGTDTVAHLAFSQKLLNNLRPVGASSTSAALMEAAILAGHIGRQFAKDLKAREIETVVICSLMQSMGRLLLEFYLPEDYRRIDQEIALTGEAENDAAMRLIGLPVDSLALEVAREWRMPQTILEGLRQVEPETNGAELTRAERMAAISTLAHQCAVTMARNVGTVAAARLLALTSSYSTTLCISTEALMHDLDDAVAHAHAERVQAGGSNLPAAPKFLTKALLREDGFLTNGVAGLCLRRDALTAGQAVWTTAEYLFKCLKLNRALVVVRTAAGHEVRAGLGPGVPGILPELCFGDKDSGSLVHQALAQNRVSYLEQTPSFTPNAQLPEGWGEKFPESGTVLLVPITVRRRSLGFIYCDWAKDDPNSVLLPTDLRALDNLRKTLIAVLSGRQVPHPRPLAVHPDQVRPANARSPSLPKEKQSHEGSAEE
jgi:HD-like signal output (HDOD) protein